MNPDAIITAFDDPIPYIFIENIFTEDELELIDRELEFYQDNKDTFFKSGQYTGSATHTSSLKKTAILKNNVGFFLHEVYQRPEFSAISRALISTITANTFHHADSAYWNDWGPSLSGILISYYGDGHFYKPHRDTSFATCCYWYSKDQSKYKGGEFSFTDYPDIKIKNKSNCGIIFNGNWRHQVSPVKIAKEDQGNGHGRYCFSMFIDKLVSDPMNATHGPDGNPMPKDQRIVR